MHKEKKQCDEIFAERDLYTFIDVRSPSEFTRGHISGAHNIPLFSDDIRALVGTCYVQQGREPAMHLAMQHVGPNFDLLVKQAQQVFCEKTLCVYCARGGMRSASVSWLFDLFKLPVVQLVGGYKAFRNWALDQLVIPQQVRLLGGKTGSGKTEYLHFLVQLGEQVIDLEALACHKGSVFGGDKDKQATQQQFENDLAIQWTCLDKNLPVWIEDESRKIGSVIIPEPMWLQMQQVPFYFLLARRKDRIARIVYEYGFLDKSFLLYALAEIKEHLGLERYQVIKLYIEQYEYRQAFEMLLDYYDKKYTYGLARKKVGRSLVSVRYFF